LNELKSTEDGGPSCFICEEINTHLKAAKETRKRIDELMRDHPKCYYCGGLFGGKHLEKPHHIEETDQDVCSVCFSSYTKYGLYGECGLITRNMFTKSSGGRGRKRKKVKGGKPCRNTAQITLSQP